VQTGLKRVKLNADSRMLSYLPLSHVVERMLVEHGSWPPACTSTLPRAWRPSPDLQRARPTVFFSVPRLWVKFQQGVQAKMPPAKLDRLLKLPIIKGIVKKKILTAWAWTSASSPPAAPRRCRPSCCAGTPHGAARSARATA
jgi:long-chain acyl-CoA synthetase